MLVGVRHEPQHFAAVEFTLGLHPRRAKQGHPWLWLSFVTPTYENWLVDIQRELLLPRCLPMRGR